MKKKDTRTIAERCEPFSKKQSKRARRALELLVNAAAWYMDSYRTRPMYATIHGLEIFAKAGREIQCEMVVSMGMNVILQTMLKVGEILHDDKKTKRARK